MLEFPECPNIISDGLKLATWQWQHVFGLFSISRIYKHTDVEKFLAAAKTFRQQNCTFSSATPYDLFFEFQYNAIAVQSLALAIFLYTYILKSSRKALVLHAIDLVMVLNPHDPPKFFLKSNMLYTDPK